MGKYITNSNSDKIFQVKKTSTCLKTWYFHTFLLTSHRKITKKGMKTERIVVNSYDEFASHLGQELGTSEWLEVTQERINLFADATLDHQWIHIDTERAKIESPYKSTIAHGYLTLSLLPHMWQQVIEVNNSRMLVNYGMNEMRFGQAVLPGNRVRLVAKLHDISNLRGICKAEIAFKIEIENQRKPALEGIAAFLYYFE